MFNITSRICSDVILMLWNSLIGLSRHTIKQENYFGTCFTLVDIGDNAIYMNNVYPGMTKKKKNWNEYYMYMMISADK